MEEIDLKFIKGKLVVLLDTKGVDVRVEVDPDYFGPGLPCANFLPADGLTATLAIKNVRTYQTVVTLFHISPLSRKTSLVFQQGADWLAGVFRNAT